MPAMHITPRRLRSRCSHRSLVTTVAAIAAATVVAACGSTGASAPSTASAAPHGPSQAPASQATSGHPKYTIIDINGPLSDAPFVTAKAGNDDAARLFGVDAQYSAAANVNNLVPDYTALINEAIAKHPDGLIVADFVPASFDPLIKKAVAAGIPVVVTNTGFNQWEADGAIGFTGPSPDAVGKAMGTAAHAAGAHDMVCVDTAPPNPYVGQWCKDGVAQFEGLGGEGATMDISLTDAANPAKVTQDVQGYLSAHPSVDLVNMTAWQNAPQALAAVEALGKTGKIQVAAVDNSTGTMKQIAAGKMAYTIDTQIYLYSFDAVQVMAQYLKYGIHPTGAIDTGGLIVNKAAAEAGLKVAKEYPHVRGPQ